MQPAGPAITMSLSFMGVHVATKFRARGLMSPTAAIRIYIRIYWSVPVIPPYLTSGGMAIRQPGRSLDDAGVISREEHHRPAVAFQ